MKKVLITLAIIMVAMICVAIPSYAEECQHDWGSWYTEEEPTCGTAGLSERHCTLCGAIETKSIPATGDHDWWGWEVTKKPTIFHKGKKTNECWECGKTKTKAIPKLKPFAKFKKKTYSVIKGKTVKMKAKLKFARGDKVKKWKSSNNKVATISKAGKLKAKKKGKVKITATLKSGKKATCTIKIKAPKKKPKKKKASGGTVYWTPYGKVYHRTPNCPTLSRSKTIYSGSLSECPKSRGCKVCY